MNSLGELAKNVPEHQFDNPWLAKAGMFADDPTWDDFLKAMTDYRRQLIDDIPRCALKSSEKLPTLKRLQQVAVSAFFPCCESGMAQAVGGS